MRRFAWPLYGVAVVVVVVGWWVSAAAAGDRWRDVGFLIAVAAVMAAVGSNRDGRR
ncbi:hypothetical protein [Actinokineospora diospyrosa]|uniref:MYXO-CTERM domain-containing protein n=1 Tax=Actinokineospora diospyrosa TaxID=103728 RepID=A0ABT1I9Z5_9PSEU|nr:hypothetical protein [Actinokineospora diospyrosa]MCP2269465.1 hypothetical protein [Actinokineospora diospyrosa]